MTFKTLPSILQRNVAMNVFVLVSTSCDGVVLAVV